MRLTTKGRYAVTAMLDLALHADNGPVALADISQRQGISLSYLEQLFAKLRRHELVSSVRGPGGGYRLSRASGTIDVAQVIDAVNESVDVTRCSGGGDCQQGDVCLTHHLWCDLSAQIHSFLCGITLADLVRRSDVRSVAARQECADESHMLGRIEASSLN
ncbi:Fe-S cluster assembly transcriptional regulator IscR [Aestuariirhabdus litorea]|uniref:Fe-S cluster assembly transcriptional regulator IscR n=1 Tax=Aestuariirhabdus litorea TaxID=2528527 RepID=A0A3P3VKZ7_9GAMM|nr:Fe-S cluster assembly transcriptional regulator IscR [Aestuariirhabdus litorea]RRJ83412.1 Fe-S cluster assembly transcriptional regulator IscR [Aestuariirhabdus litorea]RWW93573.1 Fe-S cluster assembly transcriptional regulator IscR [Endozoicomonadaceae bacterium GTF-13]